MLEITSLVIICAAMTLGVVYGVVLAQNKKEDDALLKVLLGLIVALVLAEVGIVAYVETML